MKVAALEEATIAHILRGVLGALEYLHGEDRIHRDLKAANILLSAAGAVKVHRSGRARFLLGCLMRLRVVAHA